MSSLPDQLECGAPYPLGASFDGLGVNFAIFSAHADRVELCLFDPKGRRELARLPLPECTDEVWHGYLPNARPGLLYGYRVHGRYAPEDGHRFNPNKLLIDPYARRLSGTLRWTDALHGYRLTGRRADLGFDKRDSAPAMPKCVVTHDIFDWSQDVRPNTPWSETIIYEAHAKGLTQLLEEAPPQERGTFAALSHPKVIDHLKRLGITAIELMPVHTFVHDRFLLEKGLRNYWGYSTLNFFTPHPEYFAGDTQDELRVAVRRLHAAGIEVILDVVFNHSCEGSELGPTLCWRGIDNATYYRLLPDNRRYCLNDTGTGNSFDLRHARVIQMVADSLRYWATSFGVDGFRFDLGLTLGRTEHGFDPNAGLFDVLRQDPILCRLKLITEPWDVGLGGYQLGNFPPGFAEWNDQYRDTARRYWRGDPGQRGELASRMAGSGDLFDRRSRRPWASVNFLTSHDGYTLADLVSYEERHNEANGEDNRDGHDNNLSRNWGAEGPTADVDIVETRYRVRRSMLVTLLASLGTPMLAAGDEFGRSQGGNNNAYCQDNEISWLDWSLLDDDRNAALFEFVSLLISLRKTYPVLRAPVFLYGENSPGAGISDIEWWDERGLELSDEDWDNSEGRALSMRRACRLADGRIEAINLLLNANDEAIGFRLPAAYTERVLLVDSARPEVHDEAVGSEYELAPHSAALIRSLFEPEP